MTRHAVILNPVAGRGYGARVENELRAHLTALGLQFNLTLSQYPGHSTELARQAALDGVDVIVAAGGDGTCQEVVNGMMAASGGKPTGTMGMIPVGSGCDFIGGLGVPPGLEDACRRLADGHRRTVDLGILRGPNGQQRYFDNVAGVGFDAVVTLEARSFRRLRGMALYLPVVLKTIFVSMKPPRAVIEFDGRRVEQSTLMFNACNGGREGGGFHVAPDADQSDGLLDLCIARSVPKLQMLQLIPHFMRGSHVTQPAVQMARTKKAVIHSTDNLVIHADGEMIATDAHRLEMEIAPGVLEVIC
jgi:diacylglycerol kinase (ATP)